MYTDNLYHRRVVIAYTDRPVMPQEGRDSVTQTIYTTGEL